MDTPGTVRSVFIATILVSGLADAEPIELVNQARSFLLALADEEREGASWPFAHRERLNIHYAPMGLDGVRLGELHAGARDAAEALLAAVLSPRGYRTVGAIRQLELDIRELEGGGRRVAEFRDPGRYYWAFFGEPAAEAPWGFRFEGHHLSLNVTAAPGAPASTLPLFLGAQPRLVAHGLPSAGVAVLGEEERLVRALYLGLDEEQRAVATLPYRAGRGHMLGQVSTLSEPAPVGLSRASMDESQQRLLDAFLGQFAGLWNTEIAAARMSEIGLAREGLHFAFVAVDDPPNSFYVRVSGPGVLIEVDNTAGGDHLHAVWHRPGADFGENLLAAHLERDHAAVAQR